MADSSAVSTVSEFIVGAYRLGGVPRVGGMGVVWFGNEARTARPVAVKVLPRHLADHPGARAAFLREVRCVARLCHPGVVALENFGCVTPEEAADSAQRVVPNTPYLVMERADASLDTRGPALNWPELRERLTAILRALAHAHARGLLHLDLKPSNVLIFDGPTPRYALADFGIARLVDELPDLGGGRTWAGTPAYMAPEQFDGRGMVLGPPADLYAVGCLAQALSTGRPPFAASSVADLAQLHLAAPVPRFEAAFARPSGLAGWMERLLAKHPDRRFDTAADALAALSSLDSADLAGGAPSVFNEDFAVGTTVSDATSIEPAAPLAATPEHSLTSSAALQHLQRAEDWPCPEDWREPEVTAWSPPPPGPSIFLMRRPPLVGRLAERDHLWARLCATHRLRRTQAVCVSGAAGAGKSALLSWLAERAGETGAGVPFYVRCEAGKADLMSQVLTRHLALEHVTPEVAVARARAFLSKRGAVDFSDAALYAELASSGRDGLRSTAALPTLGARWAALRRFFGHVAGSRVAVVCLDDVDTSPSTLAFVLAALNFPGELPLLFVLGLGSEALDPATELGQHPAMSSLEVGPLSTGVMVHLVGGLVSFQSDLAARVEAAAAGNPLHAVQLVTDWVLRGVLHAGPFGAVLEGGTVVELPSHIIRAARDLVDRLLASASPEDQRSIELFACLGLEPSLEHWQRACVVAGLQPSTGVLDPLFEAGILAPIPDNAVRLAFSQTTFQRALEARAIDAGRYLAHHSACARALSGLLADDELARHLIAAGEVGRAIPILLRAARSRLELGDSRGAVLLLTDLERVHSDAGGHPTDLAVLEATLLRARAARMRGAVPEACAASDQVLALDPPPALAAEAWLERARVLWNGGACDGALAALEEAKARADGGLIGADAERLRGLVHLQAGDLARSAAAFQEARERYEKLGASVWVATCSMNLGVVARQAGALELAEVQVREALSLFESRGARWGVAECKNELGELSRRAGDFEAAATHYEAALALNEALGSGDVVFNQLNLGLVELQAGLARRAHATLAKGHHTLVAQGRRAIASGVQILLLAAEQRLGPAADFEARILAAESHLHETGFVDDDVRQWAERAATDAEVAEDPPVAGLFSRIAASQRRVVTEEAR